MRSGGSPDFGSAVSLPYAVLRSTAAHDTMKALRDGVKQRI